MTKKQAKTFENAGLNGMDALHPAAAIQGKVDFLITCDDSFLKKAKKATKQKLTSSNFFKLSPQASNQSVL
jgi:hypothetical protein